ncbi:MAG: hypothetical protein ACTS6P_01240 [Candidatus Hodgkinia cicadicola]
MTNLINVPSEVTCGQSKCAPPLVGSAFRLIDRYWPQGRMKSLKRSYNAKWDSLVN